MKKIQEKQLYKKAIDLWGWELQISMLQEECAEVIVAVNKLFRKGTEYESVLDNLAEEIADVKIMIAQAETMFNWYNFKESIEIHRLSKLKRLQDLIKKKEMGD